MDAGGRPNAYASTMRHPSAHHHRSADFGGYDPPDYDNEHSPATAKIGASGYRGSRRRLDSAMSMGSRAGTMDRRAIRSQQQQQPNQQLHEYDLEQQRNIESLQKFSRSNRDVYSTDKDQYSNQFEQFEDEDSTSQAHEALPVQQQQQQPYHQQRSAASISRSESNKFSVYDDEQGFESDFNSPSNGGKSLRFSNDFSASKEPAPVGQYRPTAISGAVAVMSTKLSAMTTPKMPSTDNPIGGGVGSNASGTGQMDEAHRTPTPKLRFDDCVTVAKFDSNAAELFEDDDFSKAEFSFEAEDQWTAQLPKRALKTGTPGTIQHQQLQQQQQRRQQQLQQDNIRKSESVNIFDKKQDDPFEDDDFFKVSAGGDGDGADGHSTDALKSQQQQQSFKWENDFAKFDENI